MLFPKLLGGMVDFLDRRRPWTLPTRACKFWKFNKKSEFWAKVFTNPQDYSMLTHTINAYQLQLTFLSGLSDFCWIQWFIWADSQTPPAKRINGWTKVRKSSNLKRCSALKTEGKKYKRTHVICVVDAHPLQFQPFCRCFLFTSEGRKDWGKWFQKIRVKIWMAYEDHKYVQMYGLLFWVFFAYLSHFLIFTDICCVGESGTGNGRILQGKNDL